MDAFEALLSTIPVCLPMVSRRFRLGELELEAHWTKDCELGRLIHRGHESCGAGDPHWRAAFVTCTVESVPSNIMNQRRKCYRGQRLLAGQYLGHNMGKPAIVCTSGQCEHIYVGENLDRLFWNLFLKFVLTIHHVPRGVLHLKAAAVRSGAQAILLVGRSGSGKSTLAIEMAKQGAELVSNTHCLVADRMVQGIVTAVRLRGEDGREEIVAPEQLGGVRWGFGWTELGAIVFTERVHGEGVDLRRVPRWEALTFANHFSAAVGNYDLKEDVADYCGSARETARFLRTERLLVERLVTLVPTFALKVGSSQQESARAVEAMKQAGIMAVGD